MLLSSEYVKMSSLLYISSKFADEFGDGGYTDAQRTAEVGDAVVVMRDAEPENLPFDCRAFARRVVEEGCGHNWYG